MKTTITLAAALFLVPALASPLPLVLGGAPARVPPPPARRSPASNALITFSPCDDGWRCSTDVGAGECVEPLVEGNREILACRGVKFALYRDTMSMYSDGAHFGFCQETDGSLVCGYEY